MIQCLVTDKFNVTVDNVRTQKSYG